MVGVHSDYPRDGFMVGWLSGFLVEMATICSVTLCGYTYHGNVILRDMERVPAPLPCVPGLWGWLRGAGGSRRTCQLAVGGQHVVEG